MIKIPNIYRVMVGFCCYGIYYDEDTAFWVYETQSYKHSRVELYHNNELVFKNY